MPLAGARRRPGAVPPGAASVLHLQRSIGNRATARLLRQATAAKPHALKDAGIDTDSGIDGKTTKWIQAALAESEVLRPFLTAKAMASVTDGKFEIHATEEDFNQAYMASRGIPDNMTKKQRTETFADVAGYYDRSSHTAHVRSRSHFGHALHESMHKVAHPAFHIFWGDFINEGVTQYFTDCVLREQGLPELKDHKYGDELACARKLVAATNRETVARAYFLDDGALRETLMKRLKLTTDELRRAIRAKAVCTAL